MLNEVPNEITRYTIKLNKFTKGNDNTMLDKFKEFLGLKPKPQPLDFKKYLNLLKRKHTPPPQVVRPEPLKIQEDNQPMKQSIVGPVNNNSAIASTETPKLQEITTTPETMITPSQPEQIEISSAVAAAIASASSPIGEEYQLPQINSTAESRQPVVSAIAASRQPQIEEIDTSRQPPIEPIASAIAASRQPQIEEIDTSRQPPIEPIVEEIAASQQPPIEPIASAIAASQQPPIEPVVSAIAASQQPQIEPIVEEIAASQQPPIEPIASAIAASRKPPIEEIAASQQPPIEPVVSTIAASQQPSIEPIASAIAASQQPSIEPVVSAIAASRQPQIEEIAASQQPSIEPVVSAIAASRQPPIKPKSAKTDTSASIDNESEDESEDEIKSPTMVLSSDYVTYVTPQGIIYISKRYSETPPIIYEYEQSIDNIDKKREVKLSQDGESVIVVTENGETQVSESNFAELYPETIKNYGRIKLEDLFNKTTKYSIASINLIIGNN